MQNGRLGNLLLRASVCAAVVFFMAHDAMGATRNRDFKGLFGNYRPQKYTENEAENSNFGFDVGLGTLIPLTNIVSSIETLNGAPQSLNYATFFNVELGLFFTLNYHWEVFARVGYYNYDTRREDKIHVDPVSPELSIFQEFQLKGFPTLLGVKYRLSRTDFVPYVGAGAGLSFLTRKSTYDYANTISEELSFSAFSAEAILGFEFFFAPRAGIRMEVAGYYMSLPSGIFNANAAGMSAFSYEANPISARYSSGLFILF